MWTRSSDFRKKVCSVFLIGVLPILVSSCGSSTPFSRGKPSEGASSSNNKSSKEGNNKSGSKDSVVTQPDPGENSPGDKKPTPSPEEFFVDNVLPNIESSCVGCHGNPTPEYKDAIARVIPGQPESSELYLRAEGKWGSHPGIWTANPKALKALADWIYLL